METQLATIPPVALALAGGDKDTRHRMGRFARWLAESGQPWYNPDLAAYRDLLLAKSSPATVKAHLSTVRGCYRQILGSNATRDALYNLAREQRPGAGPADQKALVDELLARMGNAIKPAAAPVKVKTVQDRPDSEQVRLTAEQASGLLAAPGVNTPQDLRDTAALALLLCTGVREAELCALDVGDLRQRMGGELALHVREGKGCKERLIPYGDLVWVLAVVDRWLAVAGISTGPVLRGFYKGGALLRPGRLSVRAVQDILASYPVMLDGRLATVKPHDCRRTYARRLYDAGIDPVAIKQNLGHSDLKTTLLYIGPLDASKRRAPAIYSFDLAKLKAAPMQGRLPGVGA